MQRQEARHVDHCELCTLPTYLNLPRNGDRTLCGTCEVAVDGSPCPKCGRTWTRQFSCDWCGARVCEGCVWVEHEYDDCRNPADKEGFE